MGWSKKQIEQHKKATKLLDKIKDLAFEFIKNKERVTEYEVQQFISEEFKKSGLKSDRDPPIVAFGKNTSKVHHFPKKKSSKLRKNDLILVDLWARVNEKGAPFADITWMGYKGKKVPKEIKKIFDLVKKSRDKSLSSLGKKILSGKEVSGEGYGFLIEGGYKKNLLHSLGHCLGTKSCHGKGGHIKSSNRKELKKNLGYTIEPGIYFKKKFGVRSEIDFYINSKGKVVVTTPIQRKLVLV